MIPFYLRRRIKKTISLKYGKSLLLGLKEEISMGVTKQDIANKLNLDRTTVSKILNNRQIHNFNKKTVFKVYQTAREMGYDFTAHRQLPQRRSDRQKVELKAILTIRLGDTSVYDEGEALLHDISLHGAFITSINLPKQSLPLAPFTLHLRVSEQPLKGVKARCEIARIIMKPLFALGLNFADLSEKDRERVMDIM